MTITEIKQKNAAAGQHFFDPEALRFFRSKVLSQVYEGPGGIFFVTSEQFVGSDGIPAKRAYTVRRFNPADADMTTMGGFNQRTLYQAVRLAKQLAAGTR